VEERECTRQSESCQTNSIWRRVSKHTYYVANIDSSIISLKHSFRAPTFYEESGHSKIYSQDQKEMRGVLFSSGDCKNEIVCCLIITFNLLSIMVVF
jgi:hypothetical protein